MSDPTSIPEEPLLDPEGHSDHRLGVARDESTAVLHQLRLWLIPGSAPQAPIPLGRLIPGVVLGAGVLWAINEVVGGAIAIVMAIVFIWGHANWRRLEAERDPHRSRPIMRIEGSLAEFISIAAALLFAFGAVAVATVAEFTGGLGSWMFVIWVVPFEIGDRTYWLVRQRRP